MTLLLLQEQFRPNIQCGVQRFEEWFQPLNAYNYAAVDLQQVSESGIHAA